MTELQVAERPVVTAGSLEALDLVTRAISVVSARVDGMPHAATIDSFTIVSTEPTIGMVSLRRGSTMLSFIERAGSFAVSLLAVDQEWLSRRFASRSRGLGEAQFEGVTHSDGLWTRAPVLHGALASFEFEICQQLAAGDHSLVLGAMVNSGSDVAGSQPLLRHDRSYRSLH